MYKRITVEICCHESVAEVIQKGVESTTKQVRQVFDAQAVPYIDVRVVETSAPSKGASYGE